jgi:hypothetical protein
VEPEEKTEPDKDGKPPKATASKDAKPQKPKTSLWTKVLVIWLVVAGFGIGIPGVIWTFWDKAHPPLSEGPVKIQLAVFTPSGQRTVYPGWLYRNDSECVEFTLHYNHDMLGYDTRYTWYKQAANVGNYARPIPSSTGTFTWRANATGKGWIVQTTPLTGPGTPAVIEVTVDDGLR